MYIWLKLAAPRAGMFCMGSRPTSAGISLQGPFAAPELTGLHYAAAADTTTSDQGQGATSAATKRGT